MKKIILVAILSIVLFSCSSDESIMKESISTKIKEQLKNPDSFEFVSMEIKSKIMLDTLKKRITKESINEYKDLIKLRDNDEDKKFLEFLEKQYKFTQNFKGNKNEAAYYVTFISKGTNSYGGVIQSSYEAFVLNDDDKTTLSVTEIEN
jgi:hypothetical protein